jgi:hypothetical protein
VDEAAVNTWKAQIRKALQAEPLASDMEAYGNLWCEQSYSLGHHNDADMMLSAAVVDGAVVAFAQIGCAMFFGAAVPGRVATYFEVLGGPGQDSANALVSSFISIAADGLAQGYPQMYVPMRASTTSTFRSFRADFGSAQMVGSEIQIVKIDYTPSMN